MNNHTKTTFLIAQDLLVRTFLILFYEKERLFYTIFLFHLDFDNITTSDSSSG